MKEGDFMLNSLPEDVKKKIAERYSSIENFYNIVYALNEEYRNAYKTHNDAVKKQYEDMRYRISDDLEAFGVTDGLEIFDAIADDSDEDYVKVNYPPLTEEQKDLLRSYGIESFDPKV